MSARTPSYTPFSLDTLDACLSSMSNGELIYSSQFRMVDTISAMELCDPRMDSHALKEEGKGSSSSSKESTSLVSASLSSTQVSASSAMDALDATCAREALLLEGTAAVMSTLEATPLHATPPWETTTQKIQADSFSVDAFKAASQNELAAVALCATFDATLAFTHTVTNLVHGVRVADDEDFAPPDAASVLPAQKLGWGDNTVSRTHEEITKGPPTSGHARLPVALCRAEAILAQHVGSNDAIKPIHDRIKLRRIMLEVIAQAQSAARMTFSSRKDLKKSKFDAEAALDSAAAAARDAMDLAQSFVDASSDSVSENDGFCVRSLLREKLGANVPRYSALPSRADSYKRMHTLLAGMAGCMRLLRLLVTFTKAPALEVPMSPHRLTPAWAMMDILRHSQTMNAPLVKCVVARSLVASALFSVDHGGCRGREGPVDAQWAAGTPLARLAAHMAGHAAWPVCSLGAVGCAEEGKFAESLAAMLAAACHALLSSGPRCRRRLRRLLVERMPAVTDAADAVDMCVPVLARICDANLVGRSYGGKAALVFAACMCITPDKMPDVSHVTKAMILVRRWEDIVRSGAVDVAEVVPAEWAHWNGSSSIDGSTEDTPPAAPTNEEEEIMAGAYRDKAAMEAARMVFFQRGLPAQLEKKGGKKGKVARAGGKDAWADAVRVLFPEAVAVGDDASKEADQYSVAVRGDGTGVGPAGWLTKSLATRLGQAYVALGFPQGLYTSASLTGSRAYGNAHGDELLMAYWYYEVLCTQQIQADECWNDVLEVSAKSLIRSSSSDGTASPPFGASPLVTPAAADRIKTSCSSLHRLVDMVGSSPNLSAALHLSPVMSSVERKAVNAERTALQGSVRLTAALLESKSNAAQGFEGRPADATFNTSQEWFEQRFGFLFATTAPSALDYKSFVAVTDRSKLDATRLYHLSRACFMDAFHQSKQLLKGCEVAASACSSASSTHQAGYAANVLEMRSATASASGATLTRACQANLVAGVMLMNMEEPGKSDDSLSARLSYDSHVCVASVALSRKKDDVDT
ncbi:N-alpha-acetyltransferase [Pseudoscourfieldia marina]